MKMHYGSSLPFMGTIVHWSENPLPSTVSSDSNTMEISGPSDVHGSGIVLPQYLPMICVDEEDNTALAGVESVASKPL